MTVYEYEAAERYDRRWGRGDAWAKIMVPLLTAALVGLLWSRADDSRPALGERCPVERVGGLSEGGIYLPYRPGEGPMGLAR